VVTLFFLVIGSIEIDRGAAFTMTSDNSAVWYTVGTFYMTYKDCFEKSDAAANIRFAYACMYVFCSMFFLPSFLFPSFSCL
jgi:hypothetical protein